MTNDPVSNQIKVYDVGANVLLQTLSTHGTGGVGGRRHAVAAGQAAAVAQLALPGDLVATGGIRNDGERPG